MSSEKCEPLLGPGSGSGSEANEVDQPFVDYEITSLRSRKQTRTIRILIGLNVFLSVLLCVVVVLWWLHMTNTPKRPYC